MYVCPTTMKKPMITLSKKVFKLVGTRRLMKLFEVSFLGSVFLRFFPGNQGPRVYCLAGNFTRKVLLIIFFYSVSSKISLNLSGKVTGEKA